MRIVGAVPVPTIPTKTYILSAVLSSFASFDVVLDTSDVDVDDLGVDDDVGVVVDVIVMTRT